MGIRVAVPGGNVARPLKKLRKKLDGDGQQPTLARDRSPMTDGERRRMRHGLLAKQRARDG